MEDKQKHTPKRETTISRYMKIYTRFLEIQKAARQVSKHHNFYVCSFYLQLEEETGYSYDLVRKAVNFGQRRERTR